MEAMAIATGHQRDQVTAMKKLGIIPEAPPFSCWGWTTLASLMFFIFQWVDHGESICSSAIWRIYRDDFSHNFFGSLTHM
jgi:hypothetical protein